MNEADIELRGVWKRFGSDAALATFERSKTVGPSALFWTKFLLALGGVILLALFFEFPFFAISPIIERLYPDATFWSREFLLSKVLTRELCGLLFIFSISMLFAALFGRATYAAILTLGSCIGILCIPIAQSSSIYETQSFRRTVFVSDVFFGPARESTYALLFAAMMVATFLCAFLARTAFVRQWRVG